MDTNMIPDWDFRTDVVAAAFGKFTCNYKCPYCHRDYFLQSVPPKTQAFPLVEGVKLCNEALPGTFGLHLAGSGEPLLIPYNKLAAIISPLSSLNNCLTISLTTNGYYLEKRIDDLVRLGIKDVNVSIPSLTPSDYQKIMKVSGTEAKNIIERTVRGISSAREKDITVDLNVCVSYDLETGLENFMEVSRRYDVRVKFFPIISSPTINQMRESRYFEKLIRKLMEKQMPSIDSSGRYLKLSWNEFDGAKLCVKPGEFSNRPQECLECDYFLRCEESCWNSVRISPWYVQPCGIRTDNIYWYQENNLRSLEEKLVSGGKSSTRTYIRKVCEVTFKEKNQQVARQPFIVLEGADGSGKSALCQSFAKRLGYLHYETPPGVFRNRSIQEVLEKSGMEFARYFYYLSAMQYANNEILSILNTTGVVCDRWIQSTYLYQRLILGKSLPLMDGDISLIEPDVILVLDVDRDIQIQRLSSRERRFDKRWETNNSLLNSIRNEYSKLNGKNIVHIPNNGSIDQTVEACLEVVKTYVSN